MVRVRTLLVVPAGDITARGAIRPKASMPGTGMVRFGDGYLMVAEDSGIFELLQPTVLRLARRSPTRPTHRPGRSPRTIRPLHRVAPRCTNGERSVNEREIGGWEMRWIGALSVAPVAVVLLAAMARMSLHYDRHEEAEGQG
jgi:hypothetical protein